ncbi:MAG TPA: DUF1513 domain-containing protein [Gammaproteobacteria bacterium]
MSKAVTRRRFFKTLGAGALVLCVPGFDWDTDAVSHDYLLSACDDVGGRHFITGFSTDGRARFSLEVPQRMHGMAFNPGAPMQAVFFARRPGTDIYGVDLKQGSLLQRLASPPGRHFCGHGCFSADGRYLFTSETDYANNRGIVSVRDGATLALLDEFPSHGLDPHEIRLLPDSRTLVVANGGILTHPDRPGVNLDPQAMQPSLVYLDTASGNLLDEFRLAERQLSIRHIDVNVAGVVAVSLQYEGEKSGAIPLLASHAGESSLQLFAEEACDWRRWNYYTGSVKFNPEGKVAAVSSPRGNCLAFWDIQQKKMLTIHPIYDVCGIAYDARRRHFIVTTGAGGVHFFDNSGDEIPGPRISGLTDVRWDNHLLAIS